MNNEYYCLSYYTGEALVFFRSFELKVCNLLKVTTDYHRLLQITTGYYRLPKLLTVKGPFKYDISALEEGGWG